MSLFPLSWLKGRSAGKHSHHRSSSASGAEDGASVRRHGVTEAPKEESPRVTDTAELERHIQLEEMPPKRSLELFCPIRRARIYCHSILVDKLGGLTKFIISSLHEGHSLEDISDLTMMGEVTIKEEVDYLVRGGLLDASGTTLTSLGHQYGELLAAFNALSDGIEVFFNEFANLFEAEEPECVHVPNKEGVLGGNWIPALSRNDNYRNSLAIARDAIRTDIPFSREIKDSLYATVWIDKETTGYKKVRISNFDKEAKHVDEPCVGVIIPFVRVSYRPRYSWVEPYRDEIEMIGGIKEEHAEQLLTSLARRLLVAAAEEDGADQLIVDINQITGAVHIKGDTLGELPEGSGLIRMEGDTSLRAVLEPSECRDIFLEETGREKLYRTVFYTYEEMEAC